MCRFTVPACTARINYQENSARRPRKATPPRCALGVSSVRCPQQPMPRAHRNPWPWLVSIAHAIPVPGAHRLWSSCQLEAQAASTGTLQRSALGEETLVAPSCIGCKQLCRPCLRWLSSRLSTAETHMCRCRRPGQSAQAKGQGPQHAVHASSPSSSLRATRSLEHHTHSFRYHPLFWQQCSTKFPRSWLRLPR